MLHWARRISLASLLAVASTTASAQSNEWQFEGTFYLFAAETKTGVGGNEATLSFGDALDNLDVAFMAAFAASRGPWTFVADYMLTDLSFEGSTPGNAFSGAQVSAKTQVLTGVGMYNVYDEQQTKVDLGAGLRWFDTETTLKLRPGNAPGMTQSEDDNWIDPIVVARVRHDFSTKWSAAAIVDYGGFVDDRETWQVLLTANYEFRENWVARFGYRYLSVENDEDGQDYSFEQSGPVIGIAYRF